MGKLADKGLVRVSIYFNEAELAEVGKEAEQAGLRRVGLPVFKQKEHGFEHEKQANTDGIGLYLKFCRDYYKKTTVWRLAEAQDIAIEEQKLLERKRKNGLLM